MFSSLGEVRAILEALEPEDLKVVEYLKSILEEEVYD